MGTDVSHLCICPQSLYTAAPFISGANLGLETSDPFIATLFLSLVDESRNDASRKDNPDQGPDKDPQVDQQWQSLPLRSGLPWDEGGLQH